jgi:hypothetical protein
MTLSNSAAPVYCDGSVSLCDVEANADLLERWPHLSRPGTQAHNLIAGTIANQFARAFAPRLTPEQVAHAELVSLIEDVLHRVLLVELPAAVEYLLRKEADHGAA